MVDVDGASVERAWRAGGGRFHLRLKTDDAGSIEAFVAVLEEIRAADPDDGPEAQLGSGAPGGYVVLVDSVPDEEALAAWLDTVATRLARRGATGSLAGATSTRPPRWVVTTVEPLPSAFVSWTVDYGHLDANPADRGWLAAPAVTDAVCDEVARWTVAGGSSTLARRDTFGLAVAADPDGVAALTRATLEAGDLAGIVSTEGDRTGRLTQLAGAALTIAQVVGPDTGWRARLDALRSIITARPEHVDHAAVRPASVTAGDWAGLDDRQRLPADLREGHVRYNQHLLPLRAYDAHGLQVLREEHLAWAHDLSGWLVTDLGHGRHLVEAADLAPWYAGPLPDPAVVERARADFGPMILTSEDIRAIRPRFPRPATYDR